jgi:NAD(P)-dependent dehydrogenase (short-subunit alcohol dehydrogenase family)
LVQAFGRPHDFQSVNVAADAEVKSWANRLLNTYGPPHLLLNNAGIINRNAPLWRVGAQEFSDVIDVNIKGVANVIRHFVPAMIAIRRGVIVNFSSGWGRSTDVDVGPYCATKWAIEGLTQTLAQELPPGMAAIPLNPGIVNTDMLQSCYGSGAAAYPSPADWAKYAVPFLLGLSGAENGKSLTVPSP